MNEKEIRIPEKYEGKEVLEIGEGAFAGCDQIERIRILDHHKNFKIKKDAFENCISLRKVSFFWRNKGRKWCISQLSEII